MGEPTVHISSICMCSIGLHLHTMSTQSVETISRTARVDILATCHLGTSCCSRAVVVLLSRFKNHQQEKNFGKRRFDVAQKKGYLQMAPIVRRGIQEIHAAQRRSANRSSHKCSRQPERDSHHMTTHRTQHFLFFFFFSVSRVEGGSSAATIA
jgi:hypothetical protein